MNGQSFPLTSADKVLFLKYKDNHPLLFVNSIIKLFFEYPYHVSLLGQSLAISCPNQKKYELDHAFRVFYFSIRFTKYLTSLIKFTSIDYHRKRRLNERRNPLIFDQRVNVKEGVTYGEHLMALLPQPLNDEPTNNCALFHSSLINPDLHHAFFALTANQKKIMTLFYSSRMTDTEIAQYLKKSQQTITRSRLTALKKLRNTLFQTL